MIITVLGATGWSGQHFIRKACADGHSVRALVRNPDNFMKDVVDVNALENLTVISDVDIFSADNLAEGFRGSDAVVSCLGSKPSLMPWGAEITLYSESIKSVVEAMRRREIDRLVAMTSQYTDDDPNYGFFVRWFLKPLFIGRNLDDMRRMEKYLEEECQDINFTVVRPPGLSKGGPSNKQIHKAIDAQTVAVNAGSKGKEPMRRGDVARFMLKALTCGTYDRKFVAIAT